MGVEENDHYNDDDRGNQNEREGVGGLPLRISFARRGSLGRVRRATGAKSSELLEGAKIQELARGPSPNQDPARGPNPILEISEKLGGVKIQEFEMPASVTIWAQTILSPRALSRVPP